LQIQYGLPEIGVTEDRIASNVYLDCSCGLTGFVPCFRRSVCVGKKRPVTLSRDQRTGIFASMELIRSIFPNARLLSDLLAESDQDSRSGATADGQIGGRGIVSPLLPANGVSSKPVETEIQSRIVYHD
jgi:hypothetical protein